VKKDRVLFGMEILFGRAGGKDQRENLDGIAAELWNWAIRLDRPPAWSVIVTAFA